MLSSIRESTDTLYIEFDWAGVSRMKTYLSLLEISVSKVVLGELSVWLSRCPWDCIGAHYRSNFMSSWQKIWTGGKRDVYRPEVNNPVKGWYPRGRLVLYTHRRRIRCTPRYADVQLSTEREIFILFYYLISPDGNAANAKYPEKPIIGERRRSTARDGECRLSWVKARRTISDV